MGGGVTNGVVEGGGGGGGGGTVVVARGRRRVPDASEHLTTQELQIAQLAAGGLSNREIGQQLFLSHRTVGTHLYKVFPKLGITSRAELNAALTPAAVGGR